MGILNVTPDSFSDGGTFDSRGKALSQAERMIAEGAAIIDVGGESTRPGAAEVSPEEEIARTIPVVREIARRFPGTCLSIDTSKPEVAEKAIAAGARIINDVTGFRDPDMRRLAGDTGAGAVVMHMKGTPRTMQRAPEYEDVVAEIRRFFEDRLREMVQAGVREETIVFDPGVGFGKTLDHNREILRNLDQLVVEGRPILLGISRKSFLAGLLGEDEIENRSCPTAGITALTRAGGVALHRVHEVGINVRAMRMMEAILVVGPHSQLTSNEGSG